MYGDNYHIFGNNNILFLPILPLNTLKLRAFCILCAKEYIHYSFINVKNIRISKLIFVSPLVLLHYKYVSYVSTLITWARGICLIYMPKLKGRRLEYIYVSGTAQGHRHIRISCKNPVFGLAWAYSYIRQIRSAYVITNISTKTPGHW